MRRSRGRDPLPAAAGGAGGGAVFRAPFDVLDAGRVAAIRDPTGAIVSLWQPRTRIGATLVNDAGALCWNELVTRDGDAVARHATRLGGRRLLPITQTPRGHYAVIADPQNAAFVVYEGQTEP